jgi:hypothetical protein
VTNARHLALVGRSAAVLLTAWMLTGCAPQGLRALLPNHPPTVRLTAAPVADASSGPAFYAYRMEWLADDPDGRIACFLYAIDPPGDPTAPVVWSRTTQNGRIVLFSADSSSAASMRATRPHVFAICAVDDRGDTSEVVRRGFHSYTQCPTVTITHPRPNVFYPLRVTPSVRIEWSGDDPDGQLTSKPVKYRWLLLGPGSEFPLERAIADPDSLRDHYAFEWASHGLAGPWAGWDSTSADTTWVQFRNLTPEQPYLFVVVAFDEAGAFSPVFSLAQNMLRLRPGFASTLGPRITVYNESFVHQASSGGWTPQNEIPISVPAATPVTLHWSAEPPEGAFIESYRWMLDGDPYDDTTRELESDVRHWSSPGIQITSATVGPFEPGSLHHFCVEALDDNGMRSLAVVRMNTFAATFERGLLVVADLRHQPELTLADGCTRAVGNWPNHAELDSFLFARGDVPWQCTTGRSDPGLFAGYDFDVFRTRSIPGGTLDRTVSLDVLGHYRNVVWLTDATSSPIGPPYSLRYMSAPGRFNTLALYVRQGGRLWLAGGGAARALCIDLFNDPANDNTSTYTAFTYSNGMATELQPGRFMYDLARWRSELQSYPISEPRILRSSRADSIMARGGWSMATYEGLRSNPDYRRLPAALDRKVTGTEPVPATRAAAPTSFFAKPSVAIEYLRQPNHVLEDVDPDPGRVSERSVVDTLLRSEAVLAGQYVAWEAGGIDPLTHLRRPGSVQGTPLMTYYHGLEGPPLVFSGHDLWNYRRDQLTRLVDFVLQDIFQLRKSPVPAVSSHATAAATAGPRRDRSDP